MRVLLGTAHGLSLLDEDGELEWILKGDVTHVADGWAVVDERMVVSVEDPMTMVPVPLTAQCITSVDDTVLVGTAEAHLFTIDGGRGAAPAPVESFDAIPTRDEWYTPWGGPPDTRSITVTGDGTPLVNVHVGGVWRAGRDTWNEVIDVDRDTHQILAATDRADVVIAAAAVGYGESSDGGRTFTWTSAGLHDTYCRAVAFAEDNVLVTASTGPFTRNGAVYLRDIDSTGPFIRCDNGLPEWFPFNIDTFQLAASGSDVVIGTEDGKVFVSSDAGASWTLALDGHDPIRCVAFSTD